MKIEKMQKILENDKEIDKFLEIVESEGYHENFYLATKCFMKYVEKYKAANDRETLENVVDKTKVVLKTLKLVDGGCTRLNGKYLKILLTCQQKVLALRNKEQDIAEIEMKIVLREITTEKMEAEKMLSPFTLSMK